MNLKNRLVFYLIVGIIVIMALVLVYTEYTGRTHIIADYYAPSYVFDLTDGDALSANDLQKFIKSRNSNVENNTGVRLSYFCKKFNVNPAFVLGIAEMDSSQGMAGAGRTNKNPGNTKISYSALDKYGIEHRWHRAPGNFAVFKTWGDGYAAIALTLNNYRYYNLRGQIDPILRIYAGGPNPNYYIGVKSLMSQLLGKIDVYITLKNPDTSAIPARAKVSLRQGGKVIASKKANKRGEVVFNNLPRARYKVIINSKKFRRQTYTIESPQKTTIKEIELLAKDRSYLSGRVRKLILDLPNSEGLVIRLNGEDGELIKKTVTVKDGFYYFGNLLPGKYVVSIESEVDLPTGFYHSINVDLRKKPKRNVDFVY